MSVPPTGPMLDSASFSLGTRKAFSSSKISQSLPPSFLPGRPLPHRTGSALVFPSVPPTLASPSPWGRKREKFICTELSRETGSGTVGVGGRGGAGASRGQRLHWNVDIQGNTGQDNFSLCPGPAPSSSAPIGFLSKNSLGKNSAYTQVSQTRKKVFRPTSMHLPRACAACPSLFYLTVSVWCRWETVKTKDRGHVVAPSSSCCF